MNEDTNLSDLLAAYVASRVGLRESSAGQMRATITRFEKWAGKTLCVRDLTSADFIRAFMNEYLKTRAASTVNTKRRYLLTIWRFAYRRGITPHPPADSYFLPHAPEPRRIPDAWTIDEFGHLVSVSKRVPGWVGQVLRRRWWPAVLLTVYDTSARITSLLSVETADCNLTDGWLIVRAEYSKTWTDKVYFLSPQTIDAIKAMYDPSRRLLFEWPHCRRTLWVHCRKIVELAGLRSSKRGMSLFHKIRRTSLSYCAATSLSLAQQQAGHADPRLTMKHYIDPRIARQQTAVDVIPRPDLNVPLTFRPTS